MHGDFFWGFLLSRNYKIQIVARVGRKSAVVLSGLMEASYRHFFIGQVSGSSRSKFLLLIDEPQKLTLTSLQPPQEWKNRTRLDEHYFFYYRVPLEDII